MRNPLSDKVIKMKPSGIRKFFDIVSEMPDAISLGVGEPDFDTPWSVREEGIYSLEKGRTFYTSNAGLLELREAICEYTDRRFHIAYNPKSEVLLTVGGSEGIDVALRAMLNPGDEVIIPEPCFVSYVPCVELADGVPVIISLKNENRFRLTKEELEKAEFYIDTPQENKGKWKSAFKVERPMQIELGCGKGQFIANLGVRNSNINFIGVDLIDTMLGLAKRKIEEVYQRENRPIDNVILTRCNIEQILTMLDEEDKIERIYINFCNPWPRGKHHKKRLTHIRHDLHSQILEQNTITEHENMFLRQGVKIKALKARYCK